MVSIARWIASSSAVLPFVVAYIRRFWISGALVVKGTASSALLEKFTRKNSSSGLAFLRNSTTASRACESFGAMLALTSKTIPTDTGVSSVKTFTTSCSTLPSNTRNWRASIPTSGWFLASVTLTGISTRLVSTRISLRRATRGSSVAPLAACAAIANSNAHAPIFIAATSECLTVILTQPSWLESTTQVGWVKC